MMIYSRIGNNPSFDNKENLISENIKKDFELKNVEQIQKVNKNRKINFISNS